MRFGLKGEIASPRHQESQQNQSLGDGWRNAGRSNRLIAALLLAAAGAVQASEPDLLTFDRVAYELAVLDVIQTDPPAEPGDLLFENGGEWVPPLNPCAHLPPDEPVGICHCPPAPPWGVCL